MCLARDGRGSSGAACAKEDFARQAICANVFWCRLGRLLAAKASNSSVQLPPKCMKQCLELGIGTDASIRLSATSMTAVMTFVYSIRRETHPRSIPAAVSRPLSGRTDAGSRLPSSGSGVGCRSYLATREKASGIKTRVMPLRRYFSTGTKYRLQRLLISHQTGRGGLAMKWLWQRALVDYGAAMLIMCGGLAVTWFVIGTV